MSDALFLDSGKSLRADSDVWYRIIQRLGAGGSAVTYLVVAKSGENKGILFALKIFRRMSKPERRESFLREVEFLKAQEHPAIMRVFDEGLFVYNVAGIQSEYPFVVAEYLPRTLYHVIRANGASVAEPCYHCYPTAIGALLLGAEHAASGAPGHQTAKHFR